MDVVRFLLADDLHINVNAVDRFGGTPMHNAIDAGHRECVALLKAAGATFAPEYDTGLPLTPPLALTRSLAQAPRCANSRRLGISRPLSCMHRRGWT